MKNTIFILLILFTLFSSSVFAQRTQHQFDREKYESARVAFITNRLDLKPEQAEKFWPLFNKFNEEREQMMREMSKINKESEGDVNESKAQELINKRFKIQQSMLDLEKSFTKDISKVISPSQALKLGGVSRDFVRQIYRMNQRNGE
ncbi:Spy/CpxP family protein refolding chaperone [Belliella sp. R4-6]|uniref:Spy/CpxP family protein refolding chaperone n=1 Tax=Belliella alkalica TaxID=1730871 RepID=A0ABS9VEG3_9BACT|nr:Spy/CpxP family protein refolding chaperone [Belliella alkalica]MCH7414278.1 Spy/CpxP family protein refolding chaperone [Belliella alkalica]